MEQGVLPPSASRSAAISGCAASAASAPPSSANRSRNRAAVSGSAGRGQCGAANGTRPASSERLAMRRLAGQAALHCGRLLHALATLAFGLALLAMFVVGGVAWRLSQGPINVDWLARRLETAIPAETGHRLHIGSASLAWEGWRSGLDRPIDIRLTGLDITDASGATLPRRSRAPSCRCHSAGSCSAASCRGRSRSTRRISACCGRPTDRCRSISEPGRPERPQPPMPTA